MSKPFSFSTSLDNYKSLVWHGQSIYSRYALIRNHLRTNLGEEVAALLAEPFITDATLKGRGEAKWVSKQFTKAGTSSYNELNQEHKDAVDQKLSGYFNSVQQHADQLKNSSDSEDRNWAELIDLAFQFPDHSHLWIENDKILIVAWGFGYADDRMPPLNLKQLSHQFPSQISDDNKEEIPSSIIPESVDPEVDDGKLNEGWLKGDNENQTNDISDESIEGIDHNDDTEDSRKVNLNWLWLLLLLLIPTFWILSGGRDSVLPENPGVIPPIDTTKIVTDPDSVLTILSNRLNVAITGENKDLEKFGRRFKKEYPQEDYNIVYYDTLTYRLQLEVPAENRERVKIELPQKLSDFEMLIWYEKIYEYQRKPNDPGFQNQIDSWYHEDIKTFSAWDRSTGDNDLVIAVVDDGFDLSHPEFQGKIFKPRNIPMRSSNVNTGYNSIHGTHVAGIAIGVANNGMGVAGVAPGCKFMPVQVGDYYGRLGTTAIVDGILYAIYNGADVVNVSLGMKPAPQIRYLPDNVQQEIINNTYKEEEQFWTNLFNIAKERNVMVVLAGGNDDVLIGIDPMQRSNLTVNVSASDPNHRKAIFSNYGELSTISAPGVGIYSSIPGGRFDYLDGTSMAAPVISGSLALIKSINPTYTNAQLVELLQKTGVPVVGYSSQKKMGNIVQLDVAFKYAEEDKDPDYQVECPNVQDQINSLLLLVEKLRQQCPADVVDTLKIPPRSNDFGFALGRWRSTTKIINSNTHEELEVWFDFYADGTGRIQLIEPSGIECTAALSLKLDNGNLGMDQLQSAQCESGADYSAYFFKCSSNASGSAECFAKNKINSSNAFKFNLVRTHNILNL